MLNGQALRLPMMRSRLSRISPGFRSAVIYTGSLTLQRAITVMLLPFCVAALGPAGYGEVALMLAINSIAFAVVGFGLESAIIRTYFRLAAEPEEQRRFLSSTGTFLMTAPIVVAALSLIIFVFWQPVPLGLYALAMFGAAFQVSATVFAFAVLRAEEKPVEYAIINVHFSLVMGALLVLAVVLLELGPTGWLLANVIAWFSVLPHSLRILARYRFGWPRWTLLAPALALGLPLIPHMLAHWGLSLSDRVILAELVSESELGVYSVGYQAAAFLGLLFTAINWTAMPRYARHQDDPRKGIAALRPAMIKQVGATCGLAVGWMLTVPIVLRFVMPDSFHNSAEVVPWVTVGYCLLGLYYIPANVLTLTLGHTRWIWLGTVTAAVSNVFFNLAMVPSLGIEGAAIGTAVAYGVLFGLTSLLAVGSLRRYQPSQKAHFEIAQAA